MVDKAMYIRMVLAIAWLLVASQIAAAPTAAGDALRNDAARAASAAPAPPAAPSPAPPPPPPPPLRFPPGRAVHAFYYLWYGDEQTDGRFLHWNHAVLPHWDEAKRAQFPSGAWRCAAVAAACNGMRAKHVYVLASAPARRVWPLAQRAEQKQTRKRAPIAPTPNAPHTRSAGRRFEPPGSLHSPYYPLLGPYSSRSRAVMRAHVGQLRAAGVSVLVCVRVCACGQRGVLGWGVSRAGASGLAVFWARGAVSISVILALH